MEEVGISTLDGFTEATNYDVRAYLLSFKDFVNLHYQDIVSYYNGEKQSPRAAFFALDSLVKETNTLHDTLTLYVERFNTYDYWILLEKLADIRASVQTISNISRYLRSSILNSTYKSNTVTDYTMVEGQTIESVAKNVVDSTSPENDWMRIAIDNRVDEEDYTTAGGLALKLNIEGGSGYRVQSTLDNLTSENIYGRDLCRKLSFDEINQDLAYLGEQDTMAQTIDILANLKQGNNPAYPDQGVVKDMVVGQPASVAAYPSVIRQLQQVFASDDTIKSMIITDIKKYGDTVGFEYEVRTVLDNVVGNLNMKV